MGRFQARRSMRVREEEGYADLIVVRT